MNRLGLSHIKHLTMPLTAADQRRVEEAEAEAEAAGSTKLLVRSPDDTEKLGSLTVMCLILNRTIGVCDIGFSTNSD